MSHPDSNELPSPYLLFLGDARQPAFAKTAFGLRDWARDRCIGEWACAEASVTTGLPRLAPAAARTRGARALLIGVANVGGALNARWIPHLLEALEAGSRYRERHACQAGRRGGAAARRTTLRAASH